MSASWDGKVALAEADALPGHYYVTIRKTTGAAGMCLALGPFTQPRPGKGAHAQALGLVRKVRNYVDQHYADGCWWEYGTSRMPLSANPPVGKLNNALDRA